MGATTWLLGTRFVGAWALAERFVGAGLRAPEAGLFVAIPSRYRPAWRVAGNETHVANVVHKPRNATLIHQMSWTLVVSLWYRYAMAMTLRLSDELDKKLSDLSQRTGTSKQKIAIAAIEAHLAREGQSSIATAVFDKVMTRDKDLLERLADA